MTRRPRCAAEGRDTVPRRTGSSEPAPVRPVMSRTTTPPAVGHRLEDRSRVLVQPDPGEPVPVRTGLRPDLVATHP